MRDLIDREKLSIICYTDTEGREDTFDEGVRWVLEKIDEMPTVDAVPVRHGKWIRERHGVFCSRCWMGWGFITGVPANVEGSYIYCPLCGAKMDEGEEG